MDHASTDEPSALDATYSLFLTVNSLRRSAHNERAISAKSANRILRGLKDWSAQVDPGLRAAPGPGTPKVMNQTYVIGNVHLVCFYYYTVLIIARPYLIHHLLSKESAQSGRGRGDAAPVPPHMSSSTEEEITELSNTCMDASVFLLETCHEALQKDFLLDNMCLLQ